MSVLPRFTQLLVMAGIESTRVHPYLLEKYKSEPKYTLLERNGKKTDLYDFLEVTDDSTGHSGRKSDLMVYEWME